MIRRFLTLQLFSRRRRGAVAMMAVVGMIPAAAILAANMNSGQMTNDRRAVQDAADALAMVHGQWTARAMNIVSMNQVAATQAATVGIGSEALAGTIRELAITAGAAIAEITRHELENCPPILPFPANIGELPWVALCTSAHEAARKYAESVLLRLWLMDMEYDPGHGVDVSHDALRAIEGMNRTLFERHSRAMREIARDIADFYEVDEFHFADPCIDIPGAQCDRTASRDGMALPIEEGGLPARTQFCAAMLTGTTLQFTTFANRGFPVGRGPMTYGGSDGTPMVMDHINDETGIGSLLDEYKFVFETIVWLPRRPYPIPQLPRRIPQFPPTQLYGVQDEDGVNSFRNRFGVKLASFCIFNPPVIPVVDQLVSMRFDGPIPTFWQLRGIDQIDIPPPVRPEDMPPAFQILAYAQTDTDERVGTRVLGNAAEVQNGYAQVGVYNPDGADLFSQNWRSILMPALRMDDPRRAGQDLDLQAPPAFDDLAEALRAVNDYGTWGRVNAH